MGNASRVLMAPRPGGGTSVTMGTAAGTGTAYAPSPSVAPSVAGASATGAAYGPTAQAGSDDPSWAIDLRAAFAAITYDNTYTVPTGVGYTDGNESSAKAITAASNVNAFIASKSNGASATNHNKIVVPAGTTTPNTTS